MNPENTKIGFIGIGVMGKSMCRNLMKNGYKATIVSIWSKLDSSIIVLLRSARSWLLKELWLRIRPRKWPKILMSCSRSLGMLFSRVRSSFPYDVREVVLGENGILAGIHVISCSFIGLLCRKEASLWT